jgi:HK97 family phage major capsid protein
MDNQRINKLLNVDPDSFDFSNMKLAIETRDDMIRAIDEINQKSNGRNQTDKEVRNLNALTNKVNLFSSRIEKAKQEEQKRAQNATPYGSDEPTLSNGTLRGGKILDKEGKIRAFQPNEKITNSFGSNDVDLGAYLRAIVDKPQNDAERRMLQNSVTSGDYEMPTRIASELVDRLRASNPLLMENGAGARTVTIEGGDTKFVKITGDMSATWHTEMAEETPDDPSFGSVTMSPKTVLAMTEIGRETLQDAANVEEALTSAFVGSLNDAILDATFTGSGSDTPTGLATTVTQTEEYSNGGSPDWSNFVNASKTLYDNNVPEDNRSFVQAPDVWQTLSLITDDNSRYQDAPSSIRDIPSFTSSGVSSGEAYVADFSNVVYGFRLEITLEQHPAAAAKSYGSLWVAAARLDIATFRPNALVRIEEASA